MAREQYQTVKEVADLLKVGEPTVRRWIKDGELRAIDVGKGWRISSSDLDAFLQGHATRPAQVASGDGSSGKKGSSRSETGEQTGNGQTN
jgi:excisionase family DNA binding protein